MKPLNNEIMALSQSGYHWGAITSPECINCLKGISTYTTGCAAIGAASIPTGGVMAIIAALATPLLEGVAGVGTIRTYCPPCWQQISAE